MCVEMDQVKIVDSEQAANQLLAEGGWTILHFNTLATNTTHPALGTVMNITHMIAMAHMAVDRVGSPVREFSPLRPVDPAPEA